MSELRAGHAARLDLPIALAGRIVTDGEAVEGAEVRAQNATAITGPDGTFDLRGLKRHNSVVDVVGPDHLPERLPVVLDVPTTLGHVDLGDIELLARIAGRQRIVFGGDVALGRRYLDPTGATPRNQVPESNPDALVRVDAAYEDTAQVLASVGEMLEPHDFASVNLESVVTANPDRPWEERSHLMFSLPDSITALRDAGVDHVSLGNNHIWDYNQQGVTDTLDHLNGIGLAHSGAGATSVHAMAAHVADGVDASAPSIALHSLVSIEGVKGPNATAARVDRGGGGDLNDGPNVRDTIGASASAGHLTVGLAHTGYEYTEAPPPDDFTVRKMRALIDLGADLVVGHHPHIPQGFEFHDDTLLAYSLGNLAFDQLRLDTTQGALLATTFDGRELADAQVVPVFIDDYTPRWAVGSAVDLLLRRLAWLGDDNATVVADAPGSGARVTPADDAEGETRTVEIALNPDASGTAYLDLRQIRRPNESLAAVRGAQTADVSWGRDLMVYGDMEDPDTDSVHGETPFWSYGTSTLPCSTEALRGVGALCSLRDDTNTGPASMSFTRRIRVVGDRINEPNKDLTLVLHAAGDNRGDLWVEADFRPSQGNLDFGSRLLAELPGGTMEWTSYWVPVAMPPDDPATLPDPRSDHPYDPLPGFENARALRVSLRHQPPAEGVGLAVIDDVAVISWEPATQRVPNPFDFVRIHNATPGHVVSVDLFAHR